MLVNFLHTLLRCGWLWMGVNLCLPWDNLRLAFASEILLESHQQNIWKNIMHVQYFDESYWNQMHLAWYTSFIETYHAEDITRVECVYPFLLANVAAENTLVSVHRTLHNQLSATFSDTYSLLCIVTDALRLFPMGVPIIYCVVILSWANIMGGNTVLLT